MDLIVNMSKEHSSDILKSRAGMILRSEHKELILTQSLRCNSCVNNTDEEQHAQNVTDFVVFMEDLHQSCE